MKNKRLKDIAFTREQIVQGNNLSEKHTDGDIFYQIRFLQEDAKKKGYMISNIGEIYSWYKEIRDGKRKSLHNS